jgi:hypothetical protein
VPYVPVPAIPSAARPSWPSPPSPPSARGLTLLSGLELRYAALLVLHQRFGLPRTIPEMLDDLRSLGVWPAVLPPNKALADALRWEVARERVERVAHGRYRLGYLPDTTRRRARRAVRLAVHAGRPPSLFATSERIR